MGTSADFPPFESLKNGKIVGIDVEIAKNIAKKLGVKLETDLELKISDLSLSSLMFELKNGTIDFMASGFSYTEERARNVNFSESYFTASQEIIVKKNSEIKEPNDLSGKKIGVQLGTTGDSYCTNLGNMEVVRFDKITDSIVALSNGNIDAVVIDGFSADKIVSKNANLHKIPKNLTEESYSIGVKKGNTKLLKIVNEVLLEMKQNGELEKIINSYMQPEYVEESKSFFEEYSPYIIEGIANTLKITFFAAIIGILLGVLMASLKVASKSNKRMKIFDVFVTFYTTITRGTPALVQLFIMYYVIFSRISKNPITAAIITFGINSGAYVCEHVRAGIEAIERGQFEAGRSLGISERVLMSKIIVPQAIKNILPSLTGEIISLLKETAVVGFIGVMDLSLAGKKITSVTFEPALPLFIVAAIYLILVAGLTFIHKKIERRMKKSDSY
jgi:polar amino acid transport system substrate-binding protein